MSGFQGFSDRALEFYAGVEADNSREYWARERATYEHYVREPMLALLAAVEEEFGPGKAFRPHRDVRFSTDKAPLKDHQGAFVGERTGVGYYLRIDAAGLLVGGGWRSHGSDEVQRYRAAVDAEASGLALVAAIDSVHEAGYQIEGDELRTRPRGYPADHPRVDLLRCRSLMAQQRLGGPDWLATPAALDEVRTAWRGVRPLSEWAAAHVATG